MSATGTGWTCNYSAPVVTCTRPGPFSTNFTNMPDITIVATVTAVGAVGNTATIAAPELDPVPGNNTSSVNVTGSNSVDLRMIKTASQSPVVPGYNFTYTLSVANLGPAPVAIGQTVTVTDTIPAGISVRAAPTGTGWTCTVPGAPPYTPPIPGPVTVTCTRTLTSTLAANGSFPTISVPVVATVGGTTTNTACVALAGAGPTDSNAANNCNSVNVVSTDAAAAADLDVTSKTASPNPVQAGLDLTYVLTIQNFGPADATNVVVTDTLGSLVTTGGFQSATPSQGTCTPSGVTAGPTVNLSCNLGTLNNGATATITIVVRPSIAATGNRTNTATVTSLDVGDPNRDNNPASVTSQVIAVADVTVTKTDTPDPVQAGTPLTYVITARNNGPSTAANVVVTDTLPANAAFLSLSATTGSPVCVTPAVNSVGGTLTCTWASIASGIQQTATVVVRPLSGAVSVQNDVAITTTTAESNSANNSATATTAVQNAAVDLVINKVDSVDPVALGQTTKYTITVTNGGPSFATNVVMTDTFPTGAPTATFSYQGNLTVSPVGSGTCVEPALNVTSGTLTCTFAGLASGASVLVTYDMRAESIAGGTSGTSFNSASVTANEPETQASNNSTTHSTTSRQAADLALTKSAPANVIPGSALAWTMNVTNNGPATSTGAQVTDTLPAGVTFVSASPGCVFAAGTVTCTLGTLANGASTSLTINVTVNAPYTGANPLVNAATVTAVNEIDTVPANNTGNASTTVTAQADLAITKTVNNATPSVGSNVTFTLTVTNNGPNDAVGAQVSDLLPAGYAFVSATPSVGSYVSGTGVWTIGALANGANATLTITATVLAGGPYLNSASVTATTQDPNPNNNNASAGTTPVAQADLQVAKTVDNGAPNVGSNVTFTITVTNNGPSSAANVQVTDVLPAGYTFVSATPSIGSYNAGTGAWTGIGTLATGGSATLTITATVLASGPYLNTATGTSTTPDPNPNNNTATAGVAPVAVASLAVTKTDNSANYTPGGTGTYVVVVTNGGPSAAAAVTVSDTLPAGVTLGGTVTCVAAGTATCGSVSGTAGQGSFGTTGATIAAGAGHSLTFTVPVAYASAMTTDPLVNTATATDPASPNASGSDSSARLPSVALVVTKTDGSSTYTPGGTATYVVTVTNTGPTDAANVTVADALPAGLTLTAAVTCTGNGVATCGTVTGSNGQTSFGTTGATLGAGAGDSLVFTVPVAFAAGMTANPLVNTATATDVATGATANGSDSNTLAAQVSLAVVKTDGSATYTPGGTATYTVTVTNGGLSTANNVTIADALPTGVTLTATVTCVANGASNCGTVSGTSGQTSFGAVTAVIVPGAGNTLVFTVPVAFAAGLSTDPLVNTATATDGPSGATGSGSDSDARAAQVTLTVGKTDNSATYTPGGTGTYVVTVRNTGASDALNVTVNDALPVGVTLNGTVTCAANGVATCGTVTGTAGQTNFGTTGAGIGAGTGNSLVFTVPVAFAANLTDNPLRQHGDRHRPCIRRDGQRVRQRHARRKCRLVITKIRRQRDVHAGRQRGLHDHGPQLRRLRRRQRDDRRCAACRRRADCKRHLLGDRQRELRHGHRAPPARRVSVRPGRNWAPGAANLLTFLVPVSFAANLTTNPLVNTVTATDVASGASSSASDSDTRSTSGASLTKTIVPGTIAPGGTATLTLVLGNANATRAHADRGLHRRDAGRRHDDVRQHGDVRRRDGRLHARHDGRGRCDPAGRLHDRRDDHVVDAGHGDQRHRQPADGRGHGAARQRAADGDDTGRPGAADPGQDHRAGHDRAGRHRDAHDHARQRERDAADAVRRVRRHHAARRDDDVGQHGYVHRRDGDADADHDGGGLDAPARRLHDRRDDHVVDGRDGDQHDGQPADRWRYRAAGLGADHGDAAGRPDRGPRDHQDEQRDVGGAGNRGHLHDRRDQQRPERRRGRDGDGQRARRADGRDVDVRGLRGQQLSRVRNRQHQRVGQPARGRNGDVHAHGHAVHFGHRHAHQHGDGRAAAGHRRPRAGEQLGDGFRSHRGARRRSRDRQAERRDVLPGAGRRAVRDHGQQRRHGAVVRAGDGHRRAAGRADGHRDRRNGLDLHAAGRSLHAQRSAGAGRELSADHADGEREREPAGDTRERGQRGRRR